MGFGVQGKRMLSDALNPEPRPPNPHLCARILVFSVIWGEYVCQAHSSG
jgi:hypothetical protein